MSGDIEISKCDICNKNDVPVSRKYYHYNIDCECHGKNHFDLVRYCSHCVPKQPSTTVIKLKGSPINLCFAKGDLALKDTGERRSGRTTRLIDYYVQELFTKGEINVQDHHDGGLALTMLMKKLVSRLMNEHFRGLEVTQVLRIKQHNIKLRDYGTYSEKYSENKV